MTLRGEVFQDPITSIKNHTDNFDMKSVDRGNLSPEPRYGNVAPRTNTMPCRDITPHELLQNPAIQNIFERKETNSKSTVMGLQGNITIQLLRTFRNRSGRDCKAAKATCQGRDEVYSFTACRDDYRLLWELYESTENHTDNFDIKPVDRGNLSPEPRYGNVAPRRDITPREFLQNPAIQNVFERKGTNSKITVMGLQGDITILVLMSSMVMTIYLLHLIKV